ncbi:hypothetical protein L2744_07965 [Shewanella profunda]|nr:hypothetical protein [Shewanella profunda]MCL1089543.1 hypothetical protein [Shewanella profunda]
MKQAAVGHKAERLVNVLLNVALPYAIRLLAGLLHRLMSEWLVRISG